MLFADGTVSYNAGTGPIRPVTGMPISRDGSPNRLGSAMSIQGSDTHSKKSKFYIHISLVIHLLPILPRTGQVEPKIRNLYPGHSTSR